jgi:hypothetical protein
VSEKTGETYIVLVNSNGRILDDWKRVDLRLDFLASRIVARPFHERSGQRILDFVSIPIVVTKSLNLHCDEGR